MARLPLDELKIGDLSIWPPLLLAPMAGATDSALRILCKRQRAGLVCTELTSSHGLYYRNAKSYRFLQWTEEERPIAAQIFGAEPEIMAEAARVVADSGADLIDINMGCWVPKVAKTGAGAALLKDLPLAARVMEAVVGAVALPITVKTRVGWDGCCGSAVELARVAQECGVKAVTIHGRFARQGFAGNADWGPIAEVKAAVSIPVIGNGDVRTPLDAERMFRETGCDGVMIGRAALGDPWIFRRTLHYLHSGETPPEPTPQERLSLALEHAAMLARQEAGVEAGPETPLPGSARSQLIHYLKGVPGAAATREKLVRVDRLADVQAAIGELLESCLLAVREGGPLEFCWVGKVGLTGEAPALRLSSGVSAVRLLGPYKGATRL
jgi:nifR3 family TIM-barrel protein